MKKAIFFIRKLHKTKFIWTSEEDDLILKEGSRCQSKKDWDNLSKILNNNKNRYQCYRRYLTINPKIRKGRFTKEEDIKLSKLIHQYGKNWNLISKILQTRTPKQIKNRFENNLDPVLKKEKFTKEDDNLIMNLFNIFENKWSKYQNYFPSRSLKSIKNRFIKINFLSQNMYSKKIDDEIVM